MTSAAARPRGRLAWIYAAYCVVVLAGAFGLAEFASRVRGARPWAPDPPALHVEPGGRLYQPDALLGYAMLPGRFTVRFPTGAAFHATHGDDTLRVSRSPGGAAVPEEAPELWIFGCSFSYGWGVDDDDVYAWQVQQGLPDWRVTNFAVNGYGTIQALLRLEAELERGRRPRVALLAHAAFHDERNTFVRARRKRVAPFSRLGPLVQPFARLEDPADATDERLRIERAEVAYREWPGMRYSALIHLAEQRWNAWERSRARSRGVTVALVERFVRRAQAAGAAVVVAGIAGDTRDVLARARELGALPLALALDLDRPGMRNAPPDAHPSPLAHREYAKRVLAAVRRASR